MAAYHLVATVFTLMIAALVSSLPGLAGPDLARSRNCVACHHIERKMNGPSYQSIAAKYAKDDASIKTLAEKVIKGGGGVWGPMAMPAQPNVSAEEADTLVKWILLQQ